MKNVKVINLTPHDVNVILPDGRTLSIPPSGQIARCQVDRKIIGHVSVDGLDIPLTQTVFGVVQDLPDKIDGVVYIVSSLVAQACRDRDDLVIPDDAVRDDQGRIVGCRAFARVS